MRLADFIRANRESILVEWEAFARMCAPSSGTMDVAALRDHADLMLTAIAADLATPQGSRAQAAKSKGQAPTANTATPTAAEEHGAGRAESGFSVAQMVAEYRALRASVIRLWTQAHGALGADEVEDLTRFNEAIDQALAESIAQFEARVEQAKETFIAILGHDLRLPLGAIATSSAFVLDAGALDEPHRTLIVRIAASAKRTVEMVGELLDFTRSRLGGGIPVVRTDMDLGAVVREAAEEVRAAYPGHEIRVDIVGEQRGQWDAARLAQALGNLIGNAVQHGRDGAPVTVELRGESDKQVAVAVHNAGDVIPPDQLNGIFNPMKARQTPRNDDRGPTGSLGLGLYIAERIVDAHGGRVAVESSESRGTTFTVYLPRQETTTA
ncbi:MAG TPA: sensor histidine kinase [Gemmatimonadaceae bacterium]|nr:sensor histidine kinase [Gemmatimonadaceae bacterium]